MPEDPSRSAPVADPAPVRLRVDLAYDGLPYRGLARQPGLVTVQSTVEDALERLLGVEVRTTASGRTDRGVHALGQVLHGDVPRSVLAGRQHADLAQELAGLLPRSITVHAVREVPATFNARFSAVARAYRYRLRDGIDPREDGRVPHRDGPRTLPVVGRGASSAREPDVWGVVDRLDVPAMRRASRALLGEHDFATFCRKAPGRTTMRRIDELTLRRLGASPGRIDVRMRGRAFCHQQVRAIVGCLVDVGRGRRDERWIAEILTAQDRSLAAPVAPPHGLTLETVRFGTGIPAGPPAGVAAGARPGAGSAAVSPTG